MNNKNFSHIPVRYETKILVDKLKKQLSEKYNKATYDELMRILINKHNKIVISDKEIKELIAKSRGILI